MSESPSQQAAQLQPQQATQAPQEQSQQSADPLQQQMATVKPQTLDSVPPRVLEYSPHFGPEGQTFTVTLQSNTDKTLRIGFGTLVVDTKQYSANGYVTLSCTVPNFAITKWFVNKVPLYVLQMENDMVMESWPFGDYNYYDDQMIAPHMPSYSQADLGASSAYALTTAGSHGTNYIHSHHPQPVAPSSYMPQPHPSTNLGAGLPLSSYNPYANLLNKANLKFTGNMDDMAINWSAEEWDSHRRLVQFWRRQDGNDIHCTFAPVAPTDRQPNSIVISCIYWAEKNDCFLTSVDCIYLLESLIAVRFTVEEKNRIRRNLEGFRPITVSKCKPESAEFFKLIMSFPNPKPRNIEKDVKVFPWKVLPYALKKIISKYTASYSSTASIQTDAFHNANFPHGSTLPMTPQQQSIIESSSLIA
ncbi:hypothetical protein BGZ58_002774 [Dissophora ornata]|nr:hypothetical protein BGZ58_002774 [Dissophora ornata]